LQRYRSGAEGRISHLKRVYGLRRSRVKGDEGQQTWIAWASSPTTSTPWSSEPPETVTSRSVV